MKKRICGLLGAALIFCALAGCGNRAAGTTGPNGAETADGPRIVATIFPLYDWTRQILVDRAGNADLTLLLDSGVDLHSYQPTVDDMVKISNCNLFLYVGGESDKWVDDALAEASNQDRIVINLLDILGSDAKEEELVEGMQEEEAEEDGTEYDEHVWLSLKNAQIFCDSIAQALSVLDPDGAAEFAGNLAAYQERLADLDARYVDTVRGASVKTLLFGDRFPFRYLTDDYGLNYYAAFAGCSAETEASFQTIVFLAGKMDELGLPAVMTIDGGDGGIARTIVENTAAKSARILQLDSMQSATGQDADNGKTYLDAMENNLSVLREALP